MNVNFHMLLSKAKLGCSSFKSPLLLYLTLDSVDPASPCIALSSCPKVTLHAGPYSVECPKHLFDYMSVLRYMLVLALLNVQSIYLTIYRYWTSFSSIGATLNPIMYSVALEVYTIILNSIRSCMITYPLQCIHFVPCSYWMCI